MAYDRLSSLEAGQGGAGYSDDPAFQDLQYELKNKLQSLLSNNRKLANDVNVLGTRKDTPRLRERVHDTMEKSREICKDIGDGVKKLQTWEDLTVCLRLHIAMRNDDGLTHVARNNKSTNKQRSRAIFRQLSRSSRVCRGRLWKKSAHPLLLLERRRHRKYLAPEERNSYNCSSSSNYRNWLHRTRWISRKP